MSKASESEIKQVGLAIFEGMKGIKPSIFQKDWWSGKMMDLSMKDEAFKVEMFRFVDVFPTLRDPVQVATHLQEYFCRPEQDFPSSFQWGLNRVKPEGMIAKMAAGQIEKQVTGMASKFIAGQDAKEAMPTLRKMWKKQGLAFTLDLLGESTVSEAEADDYLARYHEILDTLIQEVKDFPPNPTLERSPWGDVPRVNVSVKISSLYSQIDPIDPLGSIDALKQRLRPLYRKAKAHGAFINMDMEHYAYKDLTIMLFQSLMSEEEFRDYPHVGMVIQAYLRDAEHDAKKMVDWAKRRGTPVTVRLVKGAYWDYETIHAEQEGWPVPVWQKKWETDASYERCIDVLLAGYPHIHTAIASHNVRTLAHATATAKALGIDPSAVEIQMLYGMAEPMKVAMQKLGFRMRDYVPIGQLVPGMAYLVRRLLENTSNESWLRASFVEGASVDALLAPPTGEATKGLANTDPITPHGFRNEPLLDFTKKEVQEAFKAAQDKVMANLGERYEPIIAGKLTPATQRLKSLNPSDTSQIVGELGLADEAMTQAALDAAREAGEGWAHTPAPRRAELVRAVGDGIRSRRLELAAWIVVETGKSWRGADADVCEAIDFCHYYAAEMLRLAQPVRLGKIPGELNRLYYKPRGVAAIISPWNFPLAILCGMAMAAVVTGNPAILKPAEQSSVVAAKFMEIVQSVGFPAGVVQFLPGYGETVGDMLVKSPATAIVAFTGSMQVGMAILEAAGKTDLGRQSQIKHVICEMGGKNAIIVDADADLDEAVKGVIDSAFGFQGQKCSACSRVIVHQSCYEEFRTRLVEATRSIEVGPATDPQYGMGPVIDAGSKRRITQYIELGKSEGNLLLWGEAPEGGFFVSPAIFDGIAPDARLAQEEVFGPVLAMIKAESFDHALQIANYSRFALTGALFSRSPANIEKAYERFDVGNLYINRSSTGALVFRQPFGGYKFSGTGKKAGGPDYLKEFMLPRVVSENTMRRGFAPEE